MIGVFDSGYGGLTIVRALIERLPQYSYVYLGDNARAPYGSRPAEEIYEFTRQGVEYLFKRGCPLVILACNTASANALRRLQQEWLPQAYPNRRVLGILVPTVEQITGVPWRHIEPITTPLVAQAFTVGVLATEQTVASDAYPKEIHKRNATLKVVQQACPDLTNLIEDGADTATLLHAIQKHVQALRQKIEPAQISAVLLGCTHYALVADDIKQLLPADVRVYEQPTIVAESLAAYFRLHAELESSLQRGGERTYITTGDAAIVATRATKFLGQPVLFVHDKLDSK